MTRALLLIAHGSPRPESNHVLFDMAQALRCRQVFDLVEVGFLGHSAPDIPAAVDSCVQAGSRSIVAVPCFLHTGIHVAHDLPRILEEQAARHPGVEFLLSSYLGASPHLSEVLLERARQALGAPGETKTF